MIYKIKVTFLTTLTFCNILHLSLGYNLQNLFQDVLEIYRPETVFAINFDNITDYLSKVHEVPVILQAKSNKTIQLESMFNKNIVVIIYLRSYDVSSLTVLTESLNYIRLTKIVFLIQLQYSENLCDILFRYCYKYKMLNVVAIFEEFDAILRLYTYNPFPEFDLESWPISNVTRSANIFRERLTDLRGYKVRTMWGDADPRTIRYQNSKGEIIIKGYAGHVFKSFAKKYNANIFEAIPVRINETVYMQRMMDYMRQGKLEISTGLVNLNTSSREYTYPLYLVDWCIILPIDYDISPYKYYTLMFDSFIWISIIIFLFYSAFYLSLLVSIQKNVPFDYMYGLLACFRGILYQPFTIGCKPSCRLRFFYMKISIFGLIMTMFHGVYLNTYLTSRPSKVQINTISDLGATNWKVLTIAAEDLALKKSLPGHDHVFIRETDYVRYIRLRNSFDTRTGYTISTEKWHVLEESQKFYYKPIFRYTNICMSRNMQMGYGIENNSMFKDIFNIMILQIQEAGLADFWKRFALFEMIEAGRFHITDKSVVTSFRELNFNDFLWLWFAFLAFQFLNMCVFLLELGNKHIRYLFKLNPIH